MSNEGECRCLDLEARLTDYERVFREIAEPSTELLSDAFEYRKWARSLASSTLKDND